MVKKIVLIVVLCLIAAVVVAALVVDSKFGVIWGSPRIPHATLVKPETRAMLSVDVPRAVALLAQACDLGDTEACERAESLR